MSKHRWTLRRVSRWTGQFVCVRCGVIDSPGRQLRALFGHDHCNAKGSLTP